MAAISAAATTATIVTPSVAGARELAGTAADDRGDRQREQPGQRHPAGERPAHLGQPAAEARAEDAAGHDLRRRQGEAEVRRGQQHGGRGGLGGEALRRLDVGQALAHRADDPPAAHVGAEADRETGGQHDPHRRSRARAQVPGRDQDERDDAHRLLRVARAVRERHHRRRHRLAVLEAAVDRRAAGAPGERVGQVRRAERDHAADERRRDGRHQDLLDDDVEVDRARAGADPDRADQTAEQRVRRRGRQPEQPGHQVPQHGTDQAAEDDRGRHLGVVDEAAGDRLGDLGRQERSDDVEDAADERRPPWAAAPPWRWTWPSRWRCRGTRS